MKKGLVSIVLPIYNVEEYLNRCVESVVNQTYKSIEIILVDDGSPDNCPKLCEDWAKKDSRIKVIHKKNAGLGYARNTGMEYATGEYICFFDSDDYIAADTIERLYEEAKSNNSDIILFGHHDVNSQGVVVKSYIPNTMKKQYVGAEVQEVLLPCMVSDNSKTGSTNLWLSACFCMYSMKLIRDSNWSFVSERDIISEDVYSLLRLYKNVKSVSIVPVAFYYYCQNGASLTHTYRKDRFERIKVFYQACLDLCEELEYSAEIKKHCATPLVDNTIAAMKMVIAADLDQKEKIRIIKEIVGDKMLRKAVKEVQIDTSKRAKRLFVAMIRYNMYFCCYCMLQIKKGDRFKRK